MNSNLYVSAARLAGLFDPPLSIPFIRKLAKSGELPSVRIGRRVVFDVSAVREKLTRAQANGRKA
jgi:hypothetical protein